MVIATSDGKIFESETHQTVEQPMDVQLDPMFPDEKYDDQPTMYSKIQDIKSGNIPIYDRLKSAEQGMEQSRLSDDQVNFGRPLDAAERSIADQGVAEYHRLLNQEPRTAPDGNPWGDPGTITRQGVNTYDRELRRSPADGTFRESGSMNEDWEEFNSIRVRPQRVEPQAPRGWASTNDDGDTPRQFPQRGKVEFETKNGKQGSLEYLYSPDKKDIYIKWMGGVDDKGRPQWTGNKSIQPHELGIDKVQELMKAIVEAHPEAETITAYRAGGARVEKGGGSAKVTRQIPRERLEASVPTAVPSSTQMPGLPQPGYGAMPGTRLTDLY